MKYNSYAKEGEKMESYNMLNENHKRQKKRKRKKIEQAQQIENTNKHATMNSTIINHHLNVNGLNTPIHRQRLGLS